MLTLLLRVKNEALFFSRLCGDELIFTKFEVPTALFVVTLCNRYKFVYVSHKCATPIFRVGKGFDTEDRCSTFLRNVGKHLQDYVTLHSRRHLQRVFGVRSKSELQIHIGPRAYRLKGLHLPSVL